MSIVKAIDRAFKNKEKRGWDKIFFYFDIHETILYPDYNNTDPRKFYPYAKEILQYLSKREDIGIGLFTCSYPQEIRNYKKFFEENGIIFKYANKNPDVTDTTYGYYEDKPYFNVLFEDKAGFDAETDWLKVKNYLEEWFDLNEEKPIFTTDESNS
jgi:hypothetical protein